MFRLPHNRRTRIQLAIVAAFILAFYLGVRYAANWIEGGADFLELKDAIISGNMDDIKRQLKASASANVRNPNGGETPLHVAVQYENREAVELLLDHGANPNLQSEHGVTALHTAAWISAEMTRLMLDNGADPDVVDDENASPLHAAAYTGSSESVRLLVEHGAPLHGSANRHWGPQDGSPSVVALRAGHAEIAKYILFEAGGGDLSEENLDLLLDAAASAGDAELVRTFYEAGADPDAPDVRQIWRDEGLVYIGPLASAVMGGSVEVVETLIELSATLENPEPIEGLPLLTVAANRNAAEIITLLLEYGLDVNYADNMGQTALHSAARHNKADAAQALIDGGADVNARTNYGETPTYYAAESSSTNVLKLLLENGADPTIPDGSGGLPVTIARQTVMDSDRPEALAEDRSNANIALELLQKSSARSDPDPAVTP